MNVNASEQQPSATSRPGDHGLQASPPSIKRRQFLKSAAVVGASGLILPRFKLFGAEAPSNKLNIALIATGHRARDHFDGASHENVVALCDVNEKTPGCRRREVSQGQALRGLAQVSGAKGH